jgi:hypothetical protein
MAGKKKTNSGNRGRDRDMSNVSDDKDMGRGGDSSGDRDIGGDLDSDLGGNRNQQGIDERSSDRGGQARRDDLDESTGQKADV